MKGPVDLLENAGCWRTKMGAFFQGKRVVNRGKDLFTELGHLSWMQLFLYGITGRIFSEAQCNLFEGIWVLCTSYPDPRLWNNRIAVLAGSACFSGCFGFSVVFVVSVVSFFVL